MAPTAAPLAAGLTTGLLGTFRPTPRAARTRRSGARPVRLGRLTGAPVKQIAALVNNARVPCILDRSGSMYGAGGDPNDVAGAVIESLMDAMDRAGGGRAGFAAFGSNAPREYATGLLEIRKNRRRLIAAARTGPCLGGTSVTSGLERAAEVLQGIRPQETPIVYLITDGGFSDLAASSAALRQLPAGCVHVLLIGAELESGSQSEELLIAAGFGSVTPIDHLDVAQMAGQLWHIFGAALGLKATPTATNRKKQ